MSPTPDGALIVSSLGGEELLSGWSSNTPISVGAGWVQDTVAIAGASLNAPSGVSTPVTFTPVLPYDRADIYYQRQTNGGGVTVTGSGGSDTWTSAGSAGVIKRTVSLTRGTSPLTITPDGLGSAGFRLYGPELWDSTVKQVLVRNMARPGSKATDWTATTNAWSPGNSLSLVPADLTNWSLGLNDASVPVTDSAFEASMTTLIGISAAGGDVSLTIQNESSAAWNANATLTLQRALAAKVRGLAASGNRLLIDLPARWGDYVAANANGYMANDPHPNGSAYADKAKAIMAAITQ